jgi:hypothetical protein
MTGTAINEQRSWRRAVATEFARVMLFAVVAGVLVAAFLPKRVPAVLDWPALPAGWTPASWPYLRDQFDAGAAARCAGPQCALPFDITIRPKRGFCDCDRGVYDDVQLREVGDLDLAGASFTPRAPGAPFKAAGLEGRYRLHDGENGETAISAALHKGCDVIVIVARSRGATLSADALSGFLEQEPLATWLAGLVGPDAATKR